jgi:hypothetical protein
VSTSCFVDALVFESKNKKEKREGKNKIRDGFQRNSEVYLHRESRSYSKTDASS